ncbi:MAG: hypothetical protein H0T39_00105, partial [Actinobacteria bacterium]|nr:hypothetical protein [Actinomycetota bacterium]
DGLRERAASRHFTLEKDGGAWYAAINGTRFGPMLSLDEVDEFLPDRDGDHPDE